MAEYIYQPINLNEPGVRLLRLFRGSPTDDIQCGLFEAWINQSKDGMPYEALSYTWGSIEKAAQITVNGSTMRVTSNLYAALQHLRFEGEDRLLWIDAICIDQDNMAERIHQVQHMKYIYKAAECVVVWLGEGTEESDLVMDSMKRLQDYTIQVEGDWRHSAQIWMHVQAGLGDIDMHQIDKWRKGMELMLRRPWFRRIWILQEIANARVATVYCGKKSISARTFAQVPSIIGLQPESHSQAVLDIMPGLSRKESWWGQKRNLHTLLVKFRESEATDERDIIYALLGISSDAYISDILLPDYTKSLQQIIQDTTSFLLSHTDQDKSLYKFLHWTLPEFLESLDSLSSAVLGSASENGQEAMVELLLATNKAELDWKDKGGQTPLHLAAGNGHDAIVRRLLATSQVEVDAKDKDDQTPLSQAVRKGHELVVKLLLEKGAELELRDSDNRTPLWWAAQNGHEAVVQLLLATGQVDVNSKDSRGQTLLLWALENGHEAIFHLLFATGQVDVNSKDSRGQTLLLWATRNRHEDIVKLLLQTDKVNVDIEDEAGRTPLLWAMKNRHEGIVQLLLNKDGQTLLLWAARNGYESIVKLLLQTDKVNVDIEDEAGRTPLFHALDNGHQKVFNLLWEKGADPKGLEGFNFKGVQGTPTLSRCIINGRWIYVKGLRLDLLT
jgi:ankyrin repeat protein